MGKSVSVGDTLPLYLKKHSIKVDLNCLDPGNVLLNNLNAPVLNVLNGGKCVRMDSMKAHAVYAGDWSTSGSRYFRRKKLQFLTHLEYGLAQRPVWALWRKDGIVVSSGNRNMVYGSSRPYLLIPYSTVILEKLTGSAASQEIPRILWDRKYHHCMARPEFADGGTSFHMEGSCKYIEWTADKGRSSSLGVGRVANKSSP